MHTGHPRRTRVSALGLVALLSLASAAAGAEAAKQQPTRPMVFAHYMTCYFNSVEFYKQEIELAQRCGIDGFALNCGQWFVGGKPGNYVQAAERIYQAAKELGTGFQLMLSPDHNPGAIEDMVKRFYDHPNQFRWKGKVVLSAYGGPPSMYAGPVDRVRKARFDVLFVPNVSLPKWKMGWSYESVLDLFQDQPHMDGVFRFAADGTANDLMRDNATARRVTQRLGKIYMAGLAPAYNSPNLRDFQGVWGYAAMWESLIRDGADWVEIVTWSDYNEDSNLMPYRWQNGWDKAYYDRDESYLDVTSYYSAWFQSGRRPRITQDKLYVSYRTRTKWQNRAWNAKDRKWVDITACPNWPWEQHHDDARDFIYVTAMLTAPASLAVEAGDRKKDFDMPAGISHVMVPHRPGVPKFVLGRGGKTLLDVIGRKQIIDKETKEDSPQGYHLSNRTWTSGAAVGPVLRMEAEGGKLHGGAEVVTVGGAKAVKNVPAEGSGFTLPVKGLATCTYNVRITYCNPSDREARLTLVADGPPRAPKQYPYYIPAFLPPTGEGKFATVSFFWSLYEGTSFLKLEWQKGPPGQMDRRHGTSNADVGSAAVDAIELVRVEPVAIPPRRQSIFPEMVPIPGGTFLMGSPEGRGNPDERPQHKVTLSPFAIGACEVTNEEYERFDPAHRKHRDGFSWRDRESVIYVSWIEAAKYCNWLSTQAHLAPAYEEKELTEGNAKQKQWLVNLRADGFRLPTEAEWEYVATGRGEGRTYPWGNDRPAAGKHGNFAGARTLDIDPRLPAQVQTGVMVAGSYPAGASRDGVMDLAGNVAEWCSDWYAPYADKPQTNPCVHEPAPAIHNRVIRGGSWGYYGLSQRCADREFNNPQYGGYIYLGFRVAIPEAGWKKIKDRR